MDVTTQTRALAQALLVAFPGLQFEQSPYVKLVRLTGLGPLQLVVKPTPTLPVLCEQKKQTFVDTFTHDDEEYDLPAVKKLVADRDPDEVAVKAMKWVLPYADVAGDTERLKTADVTNPVIATHWQKKIVVLDGAHRLQVAVNDKLKTLPVKFITQAELATCRVAA
jgi:hypothetical protein